MDHSKEIKVLGSSFPKPLKLPKYPKTCIIQSLISFYGRAASHFIWNVELNALDHFMCICAIELGIVGPNLSDFSQFHKNTKIAINQLSDSLYTSMAWVGFMWYEISSLTLLMTFCACTPFIWGFWAQFPWLAPTPNTLKQV